MENKTYCLHSKARVEHRDLYHLVQSNCQGGNSLLRSLGEQDCGI